MSRVLSVLAPALAACVLAACHGHAPPSTPVPPKPTGPAVGRDPDGPHKAEVAKLIQPFIDAELVKGVVIGLYDNGALEIYGFGTGPTGKPPDGTTLFELGSITKLYTSILLADSVQRREISLDAEVAEMMPAGVAIPTRDKLPITLRELATHSSGLPRLPPSMAATKPDPYADYTEDRLLDDLQHTDLQNVPGTQITYSNYGVGLLGYALGRRIGGGYASALQTRVLDPLGLADTFVVVPKTAADRVATGTTTDFAPAPPWHWDVLAPAGALVSDARDQLALVKLELDAAANGAGPLRPAMRLTQESQLDRGGDVENEGLGLQIDNKGRYWHNGATAGFHSFLGFDPKTKRGIVILASTALSPLDRVADLVYDILDNKPVQPPTFPDADSLGPYTGSFDLAGTQIDVVSVGRRLYLSGAGEPHLRIVPLAPGEFWLEELQAVVIFEGEDGKISRMGLLLPGGKKVLGLRK